MSSFSLYLAARYILSMQRSDVLNQRYSLFGKQRGFSGLGCQPVIPIISRQVGLTDMISRPIVCIESTTIVIQTDHINQVAALFLDTFGLVSESNICKNYNVRSCRN